MAKKLTMSEEIREKLIQYADPEYREFSKKIVAHTNQEILGVRMPNIRRIAKTIAAGDFKTYLDQDDDRFYEETCIRGLVIGLAKMNLRERFPYIQKFIPKIDNWAVCDTFCGGLKCADKNPPEFWDFLQNYYQAPGEFERRFALVMTLNHFCLPEYEEKALPLIDQMNLEGYYVKMAAAWTISFFYLKNPDLTLPYLQSNHLDDWTYNKALQKITESYRVSGKDKEFILTLKRKK